MAEPIEPAAAPAPPGDERPDAPWDAPSTGDPDLDRRLGALTASDDSLRERTLDRRVLHRGRYLSYEVATVELADGERRTREVVGHPGAVAIVALDDEDRVLLVRQYRTPAGRVLLEIPAGTLEQRAAEPAEDPDVAAPRELEEETGFRADHWRRLGAFWTAPGFATEHMTLYLATGLRPAGPGRRDPDEDERLELVRLPWRDAVRAAEAGAIEDAKSLLGLLWLARLEGSGAVKA